MSKGNNYQNYYRRPKTEEAVNESVESQTEEVQDIVAAEEPKEDVKEETAEEAPVKEEPKVRKAVVVNANLVNVRKSPSTSAEIINIARKGSAVDIVASFDQEWTQVKMGNQIGFMMSKFLKEI